MSLYEEACKVIPGGVNSPVRAFRGVGGEPIFFKKAFGAYTIAADGRRFIDYVGSWGPMIVGHAHPQVIKAVQDVAANGLSFGAPTEFETRLARKVIELMPSVELVRFVSSGTEATMSAIRLARGFTGRDPIVKFEGCYHGHPDSLLLKAGSRALPLGLPPSPGVPRARPFVPGVGRAAQLRGRSGPPWRPALSTACGAALLGRSVYQRLVRRTVPWRGREFDARKAGF